MWACHKPTVAWVMKLGSFSEQVHSSQLEVTGAICYWPIYFPLWLWADGLYAMWRCSQSLKAIELFLMTCRSGTSTTEWPVVRFKENKTNKVSPAFARWSNKTKGIIYDGNCWTVRISIVSIFFELIMIIVFLYRIYSWLVAPSFCVILTLPVLFLAKSINKDSIWAGLSLLKLPLHLPGLDASLGATGLCLGRWKRRKKGTVTLRWCQMWIWRSGGWEGGGFFFSCAKSS